MKFPYNDVLRIRNEYQSGKLTRNDATQQLAFLLDMKDDRDMCREALTDPNDKYAWSHGPLLRLSDVCNTLRKWARLKGNPNTPEGRRWFNIWQEVDLAISKSNLLARLFFTEEDVRPEPCPDHKGKWSGCDWKESGVGPCACTTGSNVTGWLPTDPKFADRTEWEKRMIEAFPAKAPCGHRIRLEHDVVVSNHGVTCSWCYDNWREFEGNIREFTDVRHEPPVYDKTLIPTPAHPPTGLDAIP